MNNKKARRGNSFRGQLLKAMILLVLVLLGAFMIVFQKSKKIMSEQYIKVAHKSVVAMGSNVDYVLKEVENLSNSILSNHEMMEALKTGKSEQLKKQLYSFYVSNFHIEGIYIITKNGYQEIGASYQNGVKSFPNKELEDTTGEIIWFSTTEKVVKVLSGSSKKQFVNMGRKIIDVDSLEELGYMSIAVDERTLAESFSKMQEQEGRIFVCDQEGNIITNSGNQFQQLSDAQKVYFSQLKNYLSSNYMEYEEDGKKVVAIFERINNGRWYIVKTVPKEVLYADINRLQIYVFIGVSVLLSMILILLIIYSKKITQPIEKIMKQMKKVEAGCLDVQVEYQTNNELDDLGESFNHMVSKIQVLMDEVVRIEHNKNEMEMEVLHAQINPHFLYNTLNTIRWMAKIKGEDSISDAIVALVKLLRISISFGKNMICLEEEIVYIENYLLIQKLRFNQLFEVKYAIKEEHKKINIPKLILQPIVENSLLHGIDEMAERGEPITIQIFTQEKEEFIEIVVVDNGDGMENNVLQNIFKKEKNIDRFSKVGLNNVNQRIKAYLGEGYGLEINSKRNQGTTVIIRVPKDN